MKQSTKKIHDFGGKVGEIFHLGGLFVIGATILWTAVSDYILMVKTGHASLHDIMLLFIYLELGTMVGIYFKTHKIPVEFLVFVAITALTRELAVGGKELEGAWLLMVGISLSILLLTAAIFLLRYTNCRWPDNSEACLGEESTNE